MKARGPEPICCSIGALENKTSAQFCLVRAKHWNSVALVLNVTGLVVERPKCGMG